MERDTRSEQLVLDAEGKRIGNPTHRHLARLTDDGLQDYGIKIRKAIGAKDVKPKRTTALSRAFSRIVEEWERRSLERRERDPVEI
jgi:hypothetical protein